MEEDHSQKDYAALYVGILPKPRGKGQQGGRVAEHEGFLSGSLTKLNEVCVAISCGGGSFSPDGAYVSSWDSVTPMTGKYTTNYSQYQEDVDCVCLLKNSISSNDEV